jgi:alkanesulfonate monooxygenase SsuD/methylene tetrahydromethanopterin reductase-like flavin-dependent oxidoreductase (luciferase family)
MRVYHFSETAYPHLPDPKELETVRVVFPNSNYDPIKGADIYNKRLDEWQAADELGLDIMLNEHHQTATCTVPAVPLMAAILARITKRARILILGNPLANRRQPTRIAEEMAMIDVISRGRLDCGFIRGVPFELSAQNSNPMRMAERLWEAHDLIKKAWTTHDGPFNWEGRYFHHRQINIWPRPYQQPHPPIWVTVSSPGSTVPIAKHKYVAASFLTGFEGAKAVFAGYRKAWTDAGHAGEAPTDRFAYLALAATGETDEEGRRIGQQVLWYLNMNKVSSQFVRVPGYVSVERMAEMRRQGFAPIGVESSVAGGATIDAQIEKGNMFCGSPDTVFKQIKRFHDHIGGVGHLMLMMQAGPMDSPDVIKSLTLFAKEVYPRLKELSPAKVTV